MSQTHTPLPPRTPCGAVPAASGLAPGQGQARIDGHISIAIVCHLAQVGYIVGPAPMIAAVTKAHQFVVFTVPASLQRAVAYGLDHEERFYRLS